MACKQICCQFVWTVNFDKNRIWQDKKKTGVMIRKRNSRSNMWIHIIELLEEGAITLDDLSEFSEDLQEKASWVMNH